MPSSGQMRNRVLNNSNPLFIKNNEDVCMMNNSFLFFSALIGIILNVIIVISLNNLEKNSKCKCADLPERRFLKEWFIFMIAVIIIEVVAFTVSNEQCWENFFNTPIIYMTMVIISLFGFIMLIRLFIYIRLLKNNCECAYGNMEKFIYWYLIIIFAIFIFYILLIILLLFITVLKFFS